MTPRTPEKPFSAADSYDEADDPCAGEQLVLAGVANQRHYRAVPRVRVALVREAAPMATTAIRGSADVFAMFKDEAAEWDRERFLTVLLNQKHHVIAVEEVAVGSLTAAIVSPRELFKAVILT